MFTSAVLIGIYSYIIFFLGLLNLLFEPLIFGFTVIFVGLILLIIRPKLKINIKQFSKFDKALLLLIILQILVNSIGVFGPELAFDALWYHLTLPKIYLENHSIDFIPGGLLYYSAMPKLTEMLYVAALSFGNEIIAKLIHFSFGILTLIALYKISRKFFSKTFSLLAVVLFYSNPVVGWMSITAYVDLARTFFEVLALWAFIKWIDKNEYKLFILSSVMLGFAISTKLLAFGSLLIFTILIIVYFLYKKKLIKDLLFSLFTYWFICLFIVLSWFVFSLVNTGNPVYPFFSNIYPIKFNFSLINPLNLPDPISPLYLILIPIGLLHFKKLKLKLKIIALYSLLAIIVWQLTPNTGGGRFILPYLPALSILSIWVVGEIRVAKVQRVLIGTIIILFLFSIIYRYGTNLKYMPVIIGKQTKADFLKTHLNFKFGDFYDTDNYFKKNIKKTDMVLLYGFHNLYYVDFPFVDSSWLKKGQKFNYIAVQNGELPKEFSKWKLIYSNPVTFVNLYSK